MSGPARACVHCGLCLESCPTYRVLREEADSPRGRILLLDALKEGRAEEGDVRRHLDRCVGCLACEAVCPVSAIEYVDANAPTVELKINEAFFTSVLPGRKEPLGSPGGAENVGPIGVDLP